jgi:ParB-like chromosome segregation protein Spo0J
METQMTQLKIEYVALDTLTANPDNARVHGPKQISQIARSIDKFGFNCPIVINDHNQLLVGHGR